VYCLLGLLAILDSCSAKYSNFAC